MREHRIRKRGEEIRQRRERDPELFDWLLAEAEILAECHKAKGSPEAGHRIDPPTLQGVGVGVEPEQCKCSSLTCARSVKTLWTR
jgi:hypothetical protein